MTGRELIIYILENGLEDESIFKDGKFIGFITADEAAIRFNVGLATIKKWINDDLLDGVRIGDQIYIPANATLRIS